MTDTTPIANVPGNLVSFKGTDYRIQALAEDNFTVLVEGTPIGRIVYTFGAVNAVVESDTVDEDTLYAVAEAWFTATA